MWVLGFAGSGFPRTQMGIKLWFLECLLFHKVVMNGKLKPEKLKCANIYLGLSLSIFNP